MKLSDKRRIVVALSTNEAEMALWSNSMSFLPFTVAITDLMTMKSVVVLMPPPVELGEPPIKIITKIIITVERRIALTSKTLNPDVRQVVTWNMVVKILFPNPSIPFNVPLYSIRK